MKSTKSLRVVIGLMKLYKRIFNTGIKTQFFNSSWLLATQGVRLVAGFFVGLWIARYLGPTQFGIYNYVTSYVLILSSLASFGTNEKIIVELSNSSSNYLSILNSAFYLRITISLFLTIALLLISFCFSSENEFFQYGPIVIPIVIFQSFDLIELFNRANVNEKKSAKVRIIQIIIASIIKLYLIKTKAPLVYFFYVFTFEYIIFAVFIYVSYCVSEAKNFLNLPPRRNEIFNIVKSSWPLMIMAVSSSILSRVDNILIGNYLSKHDVGVYSASSRIIELVTIVPNLIMAANYSTILKGKSLSREEYLKRFKIISKFLGLGSILVTFIIYINAEQVIRLLYGEKYNQSYELLKIHSVMILFLSMSHIGTYWYIAEDLGRLLMFKVIGAGVSSVVLDVVFIPRFGVVGVIYSSVITYILFYYVFDYWISKTRECFFINSELFNFFKK